MGERERGRRRLQECRSEDWFAFSICFRTLGLRIGFGSFFEFGCGCFSGA